nr:hypothetical protein [uncultured bacterium]
MNVAIYAVNFNISMNFYFWILKPKRCLFGRLFFPKRVQIYNSFLSSQYYLNINRK